MTTEEFWERKLKRSRVYIIEAKISGFWKPVGIFYGEPEIVEKKKEQLKDRVQNLLIANGLNAEDVSLHQINPNMLVLFFPKLESTMFAVDVHSLEY